MVRRIYRTYVAIHQLFKGVSTFGRAEITPVQRASFRGPHADNSGTSPALRESLPEKLSP
jgi:hypothetical protein